MLASLPLTEVLAELADAGYLPSLRDLAICPASDRSGLQWASAKPPGNWLLRHDFLIPNPCNGWV